MRCPRIGAQICNLLVSPEIVAAANIFPPLPERGVYAASTFKSPSRIPISQAVELRAAKRRKRRAPLVAAASAALYPDPTGSLPSLPSGLVMPGQPEGKHQAKNNDEDDIHWIHHYALAARP